MPEETYPEWARRSYEQSVAEVVASLRRSIDRIEREALDVREVTHGAGTPYGYAAQRAHHELIWGLANSGIDYLINAASEADRVTAQNTTEAGELP